MNFIKQNTEAAKIRIALSVDQLPVDEEVFCSALSNGKFERFNKLNDKEFKELKRLVDGFTQQQFLGIMFGLNLMK